MGFDIRGKVQTVLGPVNPEDLGVTLAGDSVFIDLSNFRGPPTEASAREIYFAPTSTETQSAQRFYGIRNAQQLRLGDVGEAIEEVMLFKQWGGETIIDNGSIGLGRDPVALARVSRATGVQIIMGGSYYAIRSHPPEVTGMDEDELAEKITKEVTDGVAGTGIKPGALGETGLTTPISEIEEKVLRATGRASMATGVPIVIHPAEENEGPLHHIELLGNLGVDLSNVVMCHVSTRTDDVVAEVARAGCFLRFEGFTDAGRAGSAYTLTYSGTAVGNENPDQTLARGSEGAEANLRRILGLFADGFGDQVLICTDMNVRYRLQKYGGHGYQFLLENVLPRLGHLGFSEEDIRALFVGNPARAFTFAAPN